MMSPAAAREAAKEPPVIAAWRALVVALRRDAARYRDLGGWASNVGFWIGATYRLGVFAHALPLLLRLPLLLVHRLVRWPWPLFLNVHLPGQARIGPGLCLIHARNVYVGSGAQLGEDCLLFHEVTIGTGPLPPGLPRIGNHVDVYVGARVLGGIEIGDGAKIGANCVVNRNVPRGAVVVLAENRVIPASLVAACGPKRTGTGAPAEAAAPAGAGQPKDAAGS